MEEQTTTLALMFATAMGILVAVTLLQKISDYFKKRKSNKK